MTTGNEHRSPPLESENPAVELPGTSPEPTQQNREDQSPSDIANNAHEPDAAAPSPAAGENTTEAGVNKNGEGQSAPPNSQDADSAKVFNMGLHEKSGKDLESRLSNFLGDYKSVKTAGSRSYDYEEKYDLDKEGEENGPDARVFKVYNDEAEMYDEDMVRGFRDTLDALLVFAALFSAVVTTFVVQTAQALQTDQTQVTNYLLIEQIQLLRANGNATAIASISSSGLGPESNTYKQSDIWINGLFFASLSLSLATALLSVLAKQWLQAYMSVTSGTARDVALIRQLRFSGLKRWKLHEIVGALPLILHTSLAVFSAGLVVFIRTLYPALSWIVISISGLAFSFYLGSIILPAIDVGCPYRIPLLFKPSKYIINMVIAFYRPLLIVTRLTLHQLGVKFYFPMDLMLQRNTATARNWSLNEAEKLCVGPLGSQEKPLAYDAIFWLHDMSSNTTVRRIAAWSTAGTFFEQEEFSQSLLKFASNDMFHSLYTGEDVQLRDITSRASRNFYLLTQENIFSPPSLDFLKDQTLRAANFGRTNYLLLLLDIWKVDVNATGHSGLFPLYTAAMGGHLPTVKLVLDRGADVNYIAPISGSALKIASINGHLEIVMLLLDSGADVNIELGTALQWSSSNGHIEIVKLLLDRGADVNLIGEQHGSALQAASNSGHVEIAKLLLDRGANVNLGGGDWLYKSALQAASASGHVNIVKLLLDKEAGVNLRCGQHGSALHAAVDVPIMNLDVIKLLLDRGAEVNLKNIDCLAFLKPAEFEARLEDINILKAHIASQRGPLADGVDERSSLFGNRVLPPT